MQKVFIEIENTLIPINKASESQLVNNTRLIFNKKGIITGSVSPEQLKALDEEISKKWKR